MSKTIYVVTSGQYSGYGIEAVFDEHDLAKMYADHRNQSGGYRGFGEHFQVEEYPLNPGADAMRAGLWWYSVEFHLYTGNTSVALIHEDAVPEKRLCCYDRWIDVCVQARDEQHAIKIASEKKAEWMAQQAGIR